MIVKLGPNYVNLNEVRYAYEKPDDRGRSQVEVIWHDGAVETFAGGRIEEVEALRSAIVPAPSGYRLTDGDRVGGEPLAVIAFRIAGRRSIPITLRGEPQSNDWTITTPDGERIDAAGAVNPSGKVAEHPAQAAE